MPNNEVPGMTNADGSRGAPVWWESFSELRTANARIETKLDQVLSQNSDLHTRLGATETDVTVLKTVATANQAAIAAIQTDIAAREMSPGAWKEWKIKVDAAMTKLMDSNLVSATERAIRTRDWAIIVSLLGASGTTGGLIAKFLVP